MPDICLAAEAAKQHLGRAAAAEAAKQVAEKH
jgi:hypothetical protein